MRSFIGALTAVLLLVQGTWALPASQMINSKPKLEARASSVSVSIASGTKVAGSSSGGIDTFNGIPFAQPPVGQLRLKPPQKLNGSLSTVDATGTPAACPQMFFSTGSGSFLTQVLGDLIGTPLLQTVTNTKEDCLTINVQRPAGTKPGDKLPVLFWIFGGGFEVSKTWTPRMQHPTEFHSNTRNSSAPHRCTTVRV